MGLQESKQPERGPLDGPVSVNRYGDAFVITAKQGALETTCEVSEHNAWRLFGLLALMLGVSLPTKIAKGIRF